ncbi:MAG TPA: tetratricopeptide repeat protein [Synechococcales cyanobacterium M55_K2018_004]|nr:tetratricopeptide repeat protein [Synechococcales cyanobacterium M55_K2018_004]
MSSIRKSFHADGRSFVLFKRVSVAIATTLALALPLLAAPVQADPFRRTNPRTVGDRTEAAFRELFQRGNYTEAGRLLQTAERNEPLAYALKASLAYLNQDYNRMGENARLTRETAERLVQTDELRGNLYIAVGHFLEGAHTFTTQGTVAATPTVLSKLQQVFDYLGRVERINPNDPELNLIKGYMDLMLAVNLPFTDANAAIQRLQNNAGPDYLTYRGIAIGYRDLRQNDKALEAIDRALREAPNNPDLLYLKAQILVRGQRDRESLEFFRQALERRAQLPRTLANQIAWEQCRASNRVNQVDDTTSRQLCRAQLNRPS